MLPTAWLPPRRPIHPRRRPPLGAFVRRTRSGEGWRTGACAAAPASREQFLVLLVRHHVPRPGNGPPGPGDRQHHDGPGTLATAGREVSAAAADSATFVVLRIPAQNVGDTVTVTLLDENNQTPNPMAGGPTPAQQLGMLSSVDGSSQGGTQVQLTAERANGQVMAFAIYAPPPDFDRGPLVNPADDTAASRTINFQVTENGSQAVVR